MRRLIFVFSIPIRSKGDLLSYVWIEAADIK